MMLDLPAVIESAQSLEPLPASVGRLAVLVADVDTDLREIVEVISFDQALTGNLLRRANSAASAARNPIRTVHEAVVRLGTATVLALAMSASVSRRMARALPEYGLAEGELWHHSVRASIAAEAVRSASRTPVPPEVATAALLHDIGKLVLCRFLGPQVLGLLHSAQDDGLTGAEAESVLLEVHHGELGGLVAQHWRLPDTIVRGISYHHHPDESLEPIAYGVQLSDIAAHCVASGELNQTQLETRDHVMAELGIPADRWDKICTTTQTRYEELSSRYS